MQDDPNSLERLIEDVGREMTGAPPAGGYEGLARRVSVRIHDAEAARAPRAWSRAWLLVPAAACVLVLAVFVVREWQSRSVQLEPDATTTTETASAQPSALTPQPSARPGPDATPETAVQPSAFSPQPLVRPTPSAKATAVKRADATAGTANVAALAADVDLQPLTTAPIEVESLDVSPLVVAMTIEISTIAIDRIEIPAMP